MQTMLLFLAIYHIATVFSACKDGDDLTCSLGGKCVNSACRCDPTWKGEYCDELDLLKSNTYKAFYRSYESSWGGSVVHDGSTYHMFAADMAYNCSLNEWQTNSRVVHTTSSKPEGPYNFQAVTLKIFSHNPTVHAIAGKSGYFMYHLGEANANSGWKNCSKSFSAANDAMDVRADYEGIPNEAHTTNLNGNWENTVSPGGKYAYNNPAAFVYSNGTILLVYKYNTADNSRALGLATAPAWNANFKNIKHLPELQGEDPYIYRDPNGYFHILFHTLPHKHGATAYSKDGFDWYYNNNVAWPNYFTLENGDQVKLARRERHQLLLDSDGWPIYLFNGVEPSGESNMFTYTGVQPINSTK